MIIKKEDLLKAITLNQREIEAFGGTIVIRDLTVKEMMDVTSDDELSMLKMVSSAMVEPKLSVKELEGLGSSALDDLTKIVTALTTKA